MTKHAVIIFLSVFLVLLITAFYLLHRRTGPKAVKLIPLQERPGIEDMTNIEKYYYKVYPGAKNNSFSLKFTNSLNFYYEFVPKSYIKSQGGLYLPSEHKYFPPQLNQIWFPIWYLGNPQTKRVTSARNLYPQNGWWTYKHIDGFESNSLIECMHTKDDQDFYTVYGYWTYYARGCGVWLNIGKTLKARTKLGSLMMLGLRVEDIAGLIMNSSFMVNNSPLTMNVIDFAKRYYPNEASDKIRLIKLVKDILTPPTTDTLKEPELNKRYMLDRVNNSADWDGTITLLAKGQGYDSVQFTMAANGNGGWAHEIVFVNAEPLVKIEESSWKGWGNLGKYIRIANPHNTKANKACQFEKGAGSRVVCKSQSISESPFQQAPLKYNASKFASM